MQQRTISIDEAFDIIKRVHESMGWRPTSSSSREQRNNWFETAAAVVHYGHSRFNPLGGDRQWMIKDAGGGRPQSDDIIVRAETRAYYDLIGATGTDGYRWSIGRHSEPLPGFQNVYPPRKDSLNDLPGETTAPPPPPPPPPGQNPPPTQGPTPVSSDLAREVAVLKAQLASVIETQGYALNGIASIETIVADMARRQELLFDQQTKRFFGILVEPDGSTQPGLPQITAGLIGRR